MYAFFLALLFSLFQRYTIDAEVRNQAGRPEARHKAPQGSQKKTHSVDPGASTKGPGLLPRAWTQPLALGACLLPSWLFLGYSLLGQGTLAAPRAGQRQLLAT